MLTKNEKDFIELVRASILLQKPKLNLKELDLNALYDLAVSLSVVPMIYYSVIEIDGILNTEVGKKFLMSQINYEYKSSKQVEELKEIFVEFEKNNISFMKLKGTTLRELYPHHEMRLMGDADILIKLEQYEAIREIMKNLGYNEGKESEHELVWYKANCNVELHKCLIPSYNKDFCKYIGNGWDVAKEKNNSCEYEMSLEDNFVYLFVHFAKHYRSTGIGIKHVTDFYLYLEHFNNLDMDYINKKLKKLKLLEFWNNISRLLDVWFKGAESDEISDFLSHKLLSDGTFGTAENAMQSEAVMLSKTEKNFSTTKNKLKWSLIFPSFKGMKEKYKFLSKLPFLLPIMWVFRWFEIIIFGRQKIEYQKSRMSSITEDSLEKYQNELKYVGLDFNFD